MKIQIKYKARKGRQDGGLKIDVKKFLLPLSKSIWKLLIAVLISKQISKKDQSKFLATSICWGGKNGDENERTNAENDYL